MKVPLPFTFPAFPFAAVPGLAVLLSGMLSACGAGSDKADLDRIRQATATVKAQMIRPDSAQFKNVEAHGAAVCGEVNGSMGVGMVGYERFIVAGGKVTIESALPTIAAMDARWAKDCAG